MPKTRLNANTRESIINRAVKAAQFPEEGALRRAQVDLVDAVLEFVLNHYPAEDMKVLAKYNLAEPLRFIWVDGADRQSRIDITGGPLYHRRGLYVNEPPFSSDEDIASFRDAYLEAACAYSEAQGQYRGALDALLGRFRYVEDVAKARPELAPFLPLSAATPSEEVSAILDRVTLAAPEAF